MRLVLPFRLNRFEADVIASYYLHRESKNYRTSFVKSIYPQRGTYFNLDVRMI